MYEANVVEDKARLYSVLSVSIATVGIFFIGLIASTLAIIFAYIALITYKDESVETKIGLILGLINLCIMGLIIIGTIFFILDSGTINPFVFIFLLAFGPCGISAMCFEGLPIPILLINFLFRI